MFSEFSIFANIETTARGFKRINYGGYSYGWMSTRNEHKLRQYWSCTGSNSNRKRCIARVETEYIDGYTMMRLRRQDHICVVSTKNTIVID